MENATPVAAKATKIKSESQFLMPDREQASGQNSGFRLKQGAGKQTGTTQAKLQTPANSTVRGLKAMGCSAAGS